MLTGNKSELDFIIGAQKAGTITLFGNPIESALIFDNERVMDYRNRVRMNKTSIFMR